ncbi:MAG: hypothetical protein COU46_03340 [Candidatus Niyogibacteria bacterium CG10_big_fil_rev_8_21_14_0_10_42_19]|uniref:PDZ domain-containing protein n=1 Tax=Candidatus Niyogibacteria bacterium CG10_big_fil_rev_8_21_14_0_10_42_19 TaxID=1974725 RepID=A0A2H0TEV0_9BACT|nr:MAG: hypothetical protein COU46_03340 [Candidatus Niyogibacteria bacterium CG10_big_fil_rev_8_21_14_0_10_42_19]
MNFIKKGLTFAGGGILILVVFWAGIFVGASQKDAIEKVTNLFNKETSKPAEIDFYPFWQTWSLLEDKYVADEDLNENDMVWGAIQGMVSSLGDPYTVFLPPIDNEYFKSEVRGNFEGVGMEIGIRQDILTVISPLKNTPAYRAGVKAGDKIIEIDDRSTLNMTIEEAVRLIRGPKGSKVALTIIRENTEEPLELDIIRDTIQIPIIETETKERTAENNKPIEDEEIFVIRLFSFSENSSDAFRVAVRELYESGKKKLILDLRNNPGGYLQSAVDISSWFLPPGKIVVREVYSDGEEKIHRSKGYDMFTHIPVVILVNRGSASASEIVAGALKDHGVVKLVGEKTYGKGSVQELVPVTQDTSLKVTVARWLTPNGTSISKEGLEPDIYVEPSEDDEGDAQLKKAIEILKQM